MSANPRGWRKAIPRARKRRKLNETGEVKPDVAITHTPTGGEPKTQSMMVKLKKKL